MYQLRPNQQPPEGLWKIWAIIAGRGFGKTLAASSAINKLVKMGKQRIGIIGATDIEAKLIMVEGVSGILSTSIIGVKYIPTKQLLKWDNGAVGYILSAARPDKLRGFQFDCVWMDEFAKFPYPEEIWKQTVMATRLGEPQIIISTTPRNIKILKEILEYKDISISRGTTFENKENLPKAFFDTIMQYNGTHFGSQEIYGEMIDNSDLWTEDMIQYKTTQWEFENVVMGIDPAVRNGITGITVIGVVKEEIYVIEDYSCSIHPSHLIPYIHKIIEKHSVTHCAIESNQGGNFLDFIFEKTNIYVEKFTAHASKYKRALQILPLYNMGIIYHCKPLEDLEDQMINFNEHKCDRLDSLVWAIIFGKRLI